MKLNPRQDEYEKRRQESLRDEQLDARIGRIVVLGVLVLVAVILWTLMNRT